MSRVSRRPSRVAVVAAVVVAAAAASPAPAGAQRPAPAGLAPAADSGAAGPPPTPPAVPAPVLPPPSWETHARVGTLAGMGVGLGVGLLAYAHNARRCRGWCFNGVIPPLATAAGAVSGFAAGNVVYLARRVGR